LKVPKNSFGKYLVEIKISIFFVHALKNKIGPDMTNHTPIDSPGRDLSKYAVSKIFLSDFWPSNNLKTALKYVNLNYVLKYQTLN